jgi:hypothetical protein
MGAHSEGGEEEGEPEPEPEPQDQDEGEEEAWVEVERGECQPRAEVYVIVDI